MSPRMKIIIPILLLLLPLFITYRQFSLLEYPHTGLNIQS